MNEKRPTQDDDSDTDFEIDLSLLPPNEVIFPDDAQKLGMKLTKEDLENYSRALGDYDSDTSSIDDTSDEEFGVLQLTGDREKDHKLMAALMDCSDDENLPLRTANEIDAEKIPVEPVTILEQTTGLLRAGTVLYNMEKHYVVESNFTERTLILNTILYKKDGVPVGRIDDVFGNIQQPHYVVRPAPIIKETMTETEAQCQEPPRVQDGEILFFHEASQFVRPKEIYFPGTDASNRHDEPVEDDDEIEFSDDEAERLYKKKLKEKRRLEAQNTSNPTQTKDSRKNRTKNVQKDERTRGQKKETPNGLLPPPPPFMG